MLNRLRQLGITKQDLLIILFLLAVFLAGLVIRYSGWQRPDEFDYSKTDEKFEQQVRDAFEKLTQNELSSEQNRKLALINSLSDSLIAEKDKKNAEELKDKFRVKININTAYTADLLRLPGIGEVTADRIIEYRQHNGNFKRTEDIMGVKGIGEKKYEKIKDLITVE